MQQDLLLVGSRLHRPNAERRCLAEISGGVCQEIETRKHRLIECESIQECFKISKLIIEDYLERGVSEDEVMFISFNHRDKRKLCGGLWFAVKSMYNIYMKKYLNKSQLLREIVKEVNWNLDLNRKIGSLKYAQHLKNIIERYI